jgi:hypothetical protein
MEIQATELKPISLVFQEIKTNTIESIVKKEKQLSNLLNRFGKETPYCLFLKLQIKKLREKAGIMNADLKTIK